MSRAARRAAARSRGAQGVNRPATLHPVAVSSDHPALGGSPRVLFLGDTAGTGFGTVTRDLARALVARGVDVRLVSMNEDAGYQTDPGFPKELLPRMEMLGHPDGWLAIEMMNGDGEAIRQAISQRARGLFTGRTIKGWVPEAVFIVGDAASLKISPWPTLIPDGMPAFHYVPIEGVGLPPRWDMLWQKIEPVAMCEFGADQIAKIHHRRPPVVYHGVDPESFYPVSGKRPIVFPMDPATKEIRVLRSRAECREFLGWPKNEVIIFRCDRNMPRKNYPAMFRAVSTVLAANPNVRLIWHCLTRDEGGDLADERSKYPPDLAVRMNSTGIHDRFGGADRRVLTAMYNAADIYLSTSAEGFGLTIAEALACGTPAIGLKYSSVPEVIGQAGILVDGYLQDNIYSHFWAAPDQEQLIEVLDRLVKDRAERQRLGALGPAQVAQFNWDDAAARFQAIFEGRDPDEAPAPPESDASRPVLQLVSA